MTKPISQILREAKEVARANWEGPFCHSHCLANILHHRMLGSCSPLGFEALEYVSRVLGLVCATSVQGWNDRPGRTLDDILVALSRAAELAEADEARAAGTLSDAHTYTQLDFESAKASVE